MRFRLFGKPTKQTDTVRTTHGSINTVANARTLEFLASTDARTIAEIGADQGATSDAILAWLGGRGVVHLFDFEDCLDRVTQRLSANHLTNFVAHGNSRRTLDSYNWSLMRMLQQNPAPLFDYVYLDGAHTWAIDALTFFLIDQLLKPGGYIDFDDYHWTIDGSPTVNPRVYPRMREMYTEEQMQTSQVALIVDLLVRRPGRYEEVVPDKIFRKPLR
jgi:Methyltransferase domain